MKKSKIKTNWQTKKLGDIKSILFMRGNGLNKSLIKEDGRFNCILYGELYTKYKHPIINEVVTKTDFDGKIKSVKGDVLVPGTTTADAYGIAIARSVNKNNVILGGDINILRTKNKEILSDYLSYFLNGPAKLELASYANGTNIMHLSNKNIQKIEISYPPLPEQHRIVKILDEVFADVAKAKENAEKNLQNAKELFESYLQSVFAKKGEGWEENILKEVCELKSGTTISPSLERTEGDVLYTKVGDMNLPNNEVEINTSSRFVNSNEIKVNQIIPEGAIIFPKRGGAIATNKKRKIIKPTIVDLNTMAIIPSKKIDKDYFFHWFQLFDLNSISNGTNIPQINNYSFDEVYIPYPKSLTEQKSIVAKLDALSAETKKLEMIHQQKLADLKELKKSVLKKAFNGKL